MIARAGPMLIKANKLTDDSASAAALTALSPLDGRYHRKSAALRAYFSEFALLRARLEVEVEWFIHLSETTGVEELPPLAAAEEKFLRKLVDDFSKRDAARIKTIESTTNHDVKAVEYFLKESVADRDALAASSEFIHFACTSEDINNLAYALLLKRARADVIGPAMRKLADKLRDMARAHATQPMLARTHGQPASPTTVGKEFANLSARLTHACDVFEAVQVMGKINGATGNFNAHAIAYQELDWQRIAADFVARLGLTYQPLTAQIEPHDYIAALCHAQCRFNAIGVDLARDVWGYIALDYFRQKTAPGEIGSSAMPHKVNPIDFENAEGNLGLSNALLQHFAAVLPVSRWQRDLSDSTVLRNLGVGFGHAMLAVDSALRGLAKLQLNAAQLNRDLDRHWEVLAEAVQTVMRKYGVAQAYEQLADLTHGADGIDRDALHAFIDALAIPDDAKRRLLELTPATYTGLAAGLAAGPGRRPAR